jgi:hypothetical protein
MFFPQIPKDSQGNEVEVKSEPIAILTNQVPSVEPRLLAVVGFQPTTVGYRSRYNERRTPPMKKAKLRLGL